MTEWIPTKEPFRVGSVYYSNAPGCYGWNYGKTFTFATIEEAEDKAKELTTPVQGRHSATFQVSIDEAINPETWRENGRWKGLKTGKRKIVKGRWTKWTEQ